MRTLILFDIDGTLLLTRGAGREATRLAMLEVFGTISTLEKHTFGGKTDWQTLVELLASEGLTHDHIGARMAEFDAAMGRHSAAIIGNYPVEACVHALAAVETLRQRPDILPALVTGNARSTAPIKLRAGGFDPTWFPVGAFGNESADRRDLPPLALQRARDHWGVEPEFVIVIGDTEMDVMCARAIDAIAVVVETGFGSREELVAAHPDYIIPDLSAFEAILEEIYAR